ncbi:flagellar basal-body MS-ring/collar protein FliF [Buttiauxella gaviniae]|uniref:flagellar basal-body MS-ring/collar protein FliF n=1 Tax=Buttiauxella gaviniae TaxID=82990 RepID=UPI003C75C007
MIDKIKQRFPMTFEHGLTGNKKNMLLAAAGLMLASAIVTSLWMTNHNYVALFGSQENVPVKQVVDVLGNQTIDYRIDPASGIIMVDSSKLAKARMALAEQGVTAIIPGGYELMDKDELLGSSQFIQNVRYKRSIEGELAQSIMGLDPVEAARVHLGLMESSSFVLTNQPESSASVMVRLRAGQHLNDQQVASIVQLVAGSVPGLNAGQVRVVDQTGNLLSEGIETDNGQMAGITKVRDISQQIKSETEKNIANLLNSIVGQGNFRTSVVPQVDFSAIEETQERFAGDPRISDESINQENATDELAMGIPGSLSNRAPAAAPAQPPATAAATPATPATSNPQALSSRSQTQRKYAYDRDVRHIKHPIYKLEKMSIAVVLNQSAPALEKWTPEQFTALNKLIEDAAGVDKQRGDSLTLDRLVFTPAGSLDIPSMKWWQDPDIRDWGQMGGIGFLALLLLLLGVRPLARRFTPNSQQQVANLQDENSGVLLEGETSSDDESLVQALPKSSFQVEDNLPPQSSGLETKVEFLQTLAQGETERVAEVLKQWINSNERNSAAATASKQD